MPLNILNTKYTSVIVSLGFITIVIYIPLVYCKLHALLSIFYSLEESDVQGLSQGVSQNIVINDSVSLRDHQPAVLSAMKPLLSVLHLERTTEAKLSRVSASK